MEPRALLIGVLAAVTVGGIGLALAGGGNERAAKRAKQLAAGPTKGGSRKPVLDANAARRSQFKDSLKEFEAKQNNARKTRASIKSQIEQAGLTITPAVFWMASAGVGFTGFIIALIVNAPLLAALGIGLASTFGVPRWVLGMLRGKRQAKFVNQFADAIDVIVRGIKSGLPLNECLRIIARETSEPCKGEFVRVVDGQAVGVPIEQSLQRLFDRMPVPEVNFFNTVLLIQMKAGGNLSEALGNLSTVIRARKMMREKISALSAEAKASAMIIGSLPFFVAGITYMSSPAYISELFIDPKGHLILLFAGIWMGTGIFIMRKMINFSY